uniref:Integrase family protein n=1 Tax=Cyanothece sp. (strain PCC 7425 / ATCC 29141) TaxID=395961 RepID=B8HN20_CYAP4
MYARETKRKASAGSVQIKVSNDRLQLVFSYAGRRHYLSLGLPDSPVNRKAAQAKAKLIESDIAFDRFDPTLAKYKAQSALSTSEITPISTPTLKLLWQQYTEYKRPMVSPSTLKKSFERYGNCIDRLPTQDLSQAGLIRDYCLKAMPVNSCKRFITQLSACCDWAVKSGLIEANPFTGMAADITLPKSKRGEFDDINPFSFEERDQILEALRTDQFTKTRKVKRQHQFQHSHYYGYVAFLFLTGCRPSEAIALQWKHVSSDWRYINFEQSVVLGEDGMVCKEGLKTQAKRRFPCNARVRSLLQSLKPKECGPETLIFPSHKGGWIDTVEFQHRVWKPLLEGLGIAYRKPYQTRHSWITWALNATGENGERLTVKDVAKLAGNSPEVILKHYLGNKRELFVPEF